VVLLDPQSNTVPSFAAAAAERSSGRNRDALQQTAERADALDMPMLAADAGRLLGATIA
jgi:hypothetical protein